MARIVLLKDGQSFPYELKKFPARMGRHPDCDVQVDSNMVSRFHAQIVQIENRIMLEDLNSGNGSFLNGKQLEKNQPYPLRNNDRIKLGPIKFRFEDDEENGSSISAIPGVQQAEACCRRSRNGAQAGRPFERSRRSPCCTVMFSCRSY